MSKKKIAVIGAKGFPGFGGSAGANENIFTRLSDEYNITVYALDTHAKSSKYKGIKQIIFKSYKNKRLSVLFYYLKATLHALLKGNYNLIHVNHRVAGFIVPFLKFRYPIVLNVRGGYEGDNKWNRFEKSIFNLFSWIGFKSADMIITVQKGSVDYLKKFNYGNVYFIPNGVEDNLLKINGEIKIKYDVTFAAARIVYLKGLHLLLDALNRLQSRNKLQIIGDINQVEDYKNELLLKATTLNCDFKPLILDKIKLYESIISSHIFVFPSYYEGMSNMLLEVVSLQVPVIASDIPQNTEVFENDEVLFFKSGDANDLIEKFRWAFNNQSEMKNMANRAYNKVKNNHDWDEISLMYKQKYDTVIDSTT